MTPWYNHAAPWFAMRTKARLASVDLETLEKAEEQLKLMRKQRMHVAAGGFRGDRMMERCGTCGKSKRCLEKADQFTKIG